MKLSRLLLMLFAVISLVFGLLTGLLRIGWNIEVSTIGGHHGVMMLGGFLGTLICLERAVALKKKWGFLVPALSGLSIIFFLTGLPRLGYLSLVLASVGLIGIYIAIARLKKG